jgi:type IV pilus assembly protein PilC
MVYQYVACNEQGEIVKGKITASGEEVVNTMLSYAGYRLINLKPYVPFFSWEKLSAQFSQVKVTEIILLYRQLALLLESGINIVNSLELLQYQVSNRALKTVLHEVVTDLRGGSHLSVAMSKHPKIFSTMACRSLSIAEQTGGLETMLKQVAEYMEKDQVTSKGIKSALMYPVIASVVMVVVVGILVGFVLPSFNDLYGSLGVELPTMTRVVIDAANWLRANVLYIMLVFLVGGGLLYIYFKTPKGRYNLDKFLLKMILFGPIRHYNELSRCCRSISLLFTAGLPLTEIMPLIIQGTNNKVMVKALYEVQEGMLRGEGLSKPMEKNPIFLPMMVQMVQVGEETGNLDNSLLAVAQNYEAEAADKTKTLLGMIQPVMTLIIAVVVGIIALSLVSAMYSVYGDAF